jgi:hypothetical protein
MYPRVFHCDFSNVGQGISLRFFKCLPGYFIVNYLRFILTIMITNLILIALCN